MTSLYRGCQTNTELDSCATQNVRAAYVKDHPVFALIPRAAAPRLETYLASGQRKLGQGLESIGAVAVTVDDAFAFQNMNTPDDLSKFQ